MYKINSKTNKPDIKNMKEKTEKLMRDGIRLSKDVNELYKKFIAIQKELGSKIQTNYKINNANSPAQICNYMKYEENNDMHEACFIDNKWTSKGDALALLADMGYEFAEDILDYRKAKKYAESVKSMLDAKDPVDGRVHPTVTLGKTNRLNYSGPALMNIPKKLLWHTIAPRREGNVLFSADIKNQEPSILINLLNIEELKGALTDKRGLYEALFEKPFTQKTKTNVFVTVSEDCRIVTAKEMAEGTTIPPVFYTPIKPSVKSVYCNGERVKSIEVCNTVTNIGIRPLLPTTVQVTTTVVENTQAESKQKDNIYNMNVIWEEIKDKQLKAQGIVEITGIIQGLEVRCEGVTRKEFEKSWHAMTYGASIFGIKQICKSINGDAVYKYFSKIPQFKDYKNMCKKMSDKGMQRINTFFGTELLANEYDTSKLMRVLMDIPIQGTASDILSMLIKHFDDELASRSLIGKLEIYYTRHDELIIEVDVDWLKEVGKEFVVELIRDLTEHQIDNWIPFKVEVKEIEVAPLNLLDDSMDDMFE